MSSTTSRHLLLVALLGAAGLAAAAEPAPPHGAVGLSASASVEVPRDLLSITFSTTREGPDAAAVQSQLKQALDAALAEARKAVRPGQLDVQTGNFSIYPRTAPKGGISGWQGTAELVVEGRDLPAIAQLTGRIGTLTVARVAYGLSREAREQAEAEVASQAIARYRAKAADYARQFGHSSYAIREVNVNSNEPPPLPRPYAMQGRAMAASVDEALPVEAGKAAVTVTVSGTIQLQ
jgi:predicted secreted protein